MPKLVKIAALAALLALPAASADIAVLVRPDASVSSLSFADLRKILLGERQFWTPSLRVTLLMRAPGAREREVLLKTVYQMSEAQYRQYWIAKVFRAEAAAGPRVVYSNQMAAEVAASVPGSVAFVDAAEAPKNLTVVRIDGKLPGERGYPLK